MVTDGILSAVNEMIYRFDTEEKRMAGRCIWNMLSDFDEDKWYSMTDEQRNDWINGYIEEE